MAITIPILSEFSDKGITAAQAAFNNFKSKVGEAEGAMGKFKAGSGAALDAVKANAGMFAAAAGTAIAGFALKAIGDFQNLALEVDKFSDVTGLAAEEASKWVEVAGDMGIEAGTVEGAINRMNREIGKGTEKFEELGIEIVRTSDGAVDVNETFLNTIDALKKIQDPAQRAKVAAELLGKGWTGMAELVQAGAGTLRSALDDVSEAKIIDEAEIQKAKDLREAQDRLKDALENVTLQIGEALVPALVNATEAAAPFLELLGPMARAAFDGADGQASYAEQIGESNVQMRIFKEVAGLFNTILGRNTEETEDNAEVTQQMKDAWKGGYRAMIDAKGAAEQLNTALTDVDEALSILKGNVDERQAWRNLQDDIDQAGEAALRAFMEKTPQALRASEDALDDARLAAGNYIREIDGVPTDVKTQFIAALDQANIQQIKAILDSIAYAREVTYLPTLPPGVGGGPSEIGSGGRPIGVAPLPAIPGIKIPIGGRGGIGQMSAINLTVMGSVISENDLIETVRKGLVNAQRNGSGLVYSNV